MLSLRKAPPLSGAAAALCQGTLRVGLLRVVRWQLACVSCCAAVSLQPIVRTFLLVSFNFVVYTHDAHTHTDTHGHTHTHKHTHGQALPQGCRQSSPRIEDCRCLYCMWNGVSSLCCFLSPRLSPLIFVSRSPYQVSNRVSGTACTIPDESERFC